MRGTSLAVPLDDRASGEKATGYRFGARDCVTSSTADCTRAQLVTGSTLVGEFHDTARPRSPFNLEAAADLPDEAHNQSEARRASTGFCELKALTIIFNMEGEPTTLS